MHGSAITKAPNAALDPCANPGLGHLIVAAYNQQNGIQHEKIQVALPAEPAPIS